MSSSELSNALNPFVTQIGSRRSNTSYSSYLQGQPAVQPPQQHVPHRSVIELAISEPPQPPPSQDSALVARNTGQSGGVQTLPELMRIFTATQEVEHKRRLAWEQEQEAKYTQKQAEIERQMLEIRQEIVSLMSSTDLRNPNVDGNSLAATGYPSRNGVGMVVQQPTAYTLLSPMPTLSQPIAQPAFTEGSFNRPFLRQSILTEMVFHSPESMVIEPLSPQFIAAEESLLHSDTPSTTRKRPAMNVESSEDDDTSDSEGDESPPQRKRTSGHDSRCLTIQHAMRAHFLRAMRIDNDKLLPDSHIEGTPLLPTEPIRFVWDKTPKQSVHNSRMKARFLADLKAKRRLYKHVPHKEFGKKILDSAFDQAFVTLRQKFKAQRDASFAYNLRKREVMKAVKARRLSRKKIKLSNRSEARNRIEALQHITFDGALQMECMSEEESVSEDDTRSSGTYHIRGLPWRSTRLRNFYTTLDESDQVNKAFRPKRGGGRKERCLGPPKDGFFMPPKGVASWMISRRWLNLLQSTNPELVELVKDLVVDPPGFDWSQFLVFGAESENEDVGGAHRGSDGISFWVWT